MQTATFTIRECAASEAGALATLATRLFAQAYAPTHPEPELSTYLAREFAPARLAAELADPGVRAFLAEDATQRSIGYAYLREAAAPPGMPGRRAAEVVRFYVDAEWHGRGVAAALMAACEAEARRRGADVLWLAVWQQAARPIAFYRRAGFEVVGTTKFRFGDRLDDDYVMARRLTPPTPPAAAADR